MQRILSLFDCPLKDVEYLLPTIKYQGFSAVQISPLQLTKDESSKDWTMLYQPLNFEIGNRIGSKEDLKHLCIEANKYGILIIADTVINHLANISDSNPLTPHPLCDKDILNNHDCFKEKKFISNYKDRYEVINYCMRFPNLNPNNEIVQSKIIKMLNEYIDLGIGGFRFDDAKNIALPNENCSFFPNINYSLKSWVSLIYADIYFSNEELINEYTKYMKVLTNSKSNNKENVIVFSENKDSFLSKGLGCTCLMPKEQSTFNYYYLSSIYPNTKYYARNYCDDWHEWKSDLVRSANKQLVKK